ncbi:MAG TPA: hypothetical protein VFR79_16390 [Nitrospira sp.]|nr:hypothetical protein [Nitrospira sp.]
MKMLLVIYRQSLEDDVRDLLRDLDVKAFTEAPKVFGIGEAGTANSSFEWPGCNSLILAAMEEDQASKVIGELQAFRDRLSKRQNGAKIPMRVFALPCEQAV